MNFHKEVNVLNVAYYFLWLMGFKIIYKDYHPEVKKL